MNKQKKLHIAVIMQSPDIGGAEIYMLSLIRMFLQKKHTVSVASNREKFLKNARQLPIHSYEIPMILDIIGNYRGLIKSILLLPVATVYYTFLLYRLQKQHVSVILMSNFTEKLFVSFLSLFFKIPVVWIEYGSLERPFARNFSIPKKLYQLLVAVPKRIIVPSMHTKKSLLFDAKAKEETLICIPCGIVSAGKVHRQKSIPEWENLFLIGTVSRLTGEKGQEYLIRAMPEILLAIPDARLVIIGEGPDKSYFENIVQELELTDMVKFAGFVSVISSWYNSMDVFVFPTIWEMEGFGLVTPEAMSHKLPVIASNIGPVPEIVIHNQTGFIVPPKDTHALAVAVIDLAKDPKKRLRFGANGFERMQKNYTITKATHRILTVLSEATQV